MSKIKKKSREGWRRKEGRGRGNKNESEWLLLLYWTGRERERQRGREGERERGESEELTGLVALCCLPVTCVFNWVLNKNREEQRQGTG